MDILLPETIFIKWVSASAEWVMCPFTLFHPIYGGTLSELSPNIRFIGANREILLAQQTLTHNFQLFLIIADLHTYSVLLLLPLILATPYTQ